jgi:putative restriction endonuclease
VKDRKGQAEFRTEVLSAYGACAVTGEECATALDAAHIQSYVAEASNHVQNGLCLRSDLHRLLDGGLITIDSEYRIRVSPQLTSSEYQALNCRRLPIPTKSSQQNRRQKRLPFTERTSFGPEDASAA